MDVGNGEGGKGRGEGRKEGTFIIDNFMLKIIFPGIGIEEKKEGNRFIERGEHNRFWQGEGLESSFRWRGREG